MRQTLERLCRQEIDTDQRLDYMILLRKRLFPEGSRTKGEGVITHLPTATLRLFIDACKHLGDWPLVIDCCQEYQNRLECMAPGLRRQGQDCGNLRLLSRAYRQQGLFAAAEQCLRQALRGQHDDHQTTMDDYRRLRRITKGLPAGAETLRSDSLLLTPLRLDHEKDFFWQYDLDIAELCNLPDFGDEENFPKWLAEYQQKPTTNQFAVNHVDWGFIGSVGLEIFKDIGFFDYWLGADFQGHGFGPQAVRILLDWACRYSGLRCCYAKAYESNTHSKKAMEKLGFQSLPFKVIYPCEEGDEEEYEEEYLYYWGDRQTERWLFFEINRFFMDTGSELRVCRL